MADTTKKRVHANEKLINGVMHVSAKKLALLLGMSEHDLRRRARANKIPSHKIGTKTWFNVEKVKTALGYVEPPKQLVIPNLSVLQGF